MSEQSRIEGETMGVNAVVTAPVGGDRPLKVVVVGASSGLGRSTAVGLAQRGDSVAMLARRLDRLEAAAAEGGNGAVAVACDVTDEKAVAPAIDEAAERLGGIDALVYATGTGTLVRLVDADAELWQNTFATNVIGASLVTAAALPHLVESRGCAAYLSSQSASLTPPWPGLAPYVVTKAALDKLVEAWRNEHPEVGFTRVTVGECAGGDGDSMTEFNAGWDMDLAMEVAPTWIERNYMTGALMDVEELVRVLDRVLRCGASATIPTVAVMPRHVATS
jgi:NAD(P)-dependent dehydrogenase (short-subunit alcohol dehydrogenase family)